MMLLALAAVWLAAACNTPAGDTGREELPVETETPALNALWVHAGESVVYATIDQNAGTARIGTVRYTNLIHEVGYALSSPRATITPDPKTLLGKWQSEQTVTVALDGKQKTYNIIFTDYQEPSDNPDDGEDGIDYPYVPGLAPKDDEKQVYARPGIPFTAESMPKDTPHPNAALAAAGWRLFTVNEFSDGVADVNDKGETVRLPFGLYPHNTATMNESAVVRNKECSRVEDGRLIMEAFRLPETVNTGFSNSFNPTGDVNYKHASYRTYPVTNAEYGDWFTFAPNMRVEVRFRRTNTIGFNNAIWFQGNVKGVPWPAYGEIDLLENPKKEINYTMHATLHSQHFNSGGPKDEHVGPSISSTETLADMTRWNIYWIELYPDRVVCGVNGKQVFSYSKGEKVKNDGGAMVDNPDWPWDQAEGFYMILSTGMNDKRPNGWQGMVQASDFSGSNPPSMEFDWIRVYVNDAYDRSQAKNIFY